MAAALETDNDLVDAFETLDIDDYDDDQAIRARSESPSSSVNEREWINDLTALSSLMSHQVKSDDFVASESRLVRSKLQRIFRFVLTDIHNEPMTQAVADRISNLADVDDALIGLNRNATLKFRNYKQFREQLLVASDERPFNGKNTTSMNSRAKNTKLLGVSHIQRDPWGRSRISLSYFAHWLIHSWFFRWFTGIAICFDAISVALISEYNSTYMTNRSRYIIFNAAVLISRCVLFIYILEIILKWIDDFIGYWYSIANILEFILTIISIINMFSEIYTGLIENGAFEVLTISSRNLTKSNQNTQKPTETLRRIRSYGSTVTLLRTLRMLRILRTLEIAFRFQQVRIVFLALSRSVKIILHVVLLTIVLIYFFALIGLFLTQFGSSTASYDDMKTINSLFGTVPRAFITVFRLFTKDEWFEIKTQMHALKISPIIIDLYVIIWLSFGGYVLNPLLIGAMVSTFDETRKELTQGIKDLIRKNDLRKNRWSVNDAITSDSDHSVSSNSEPGIASLLAHIDLTQTNFDLSPDANDDDEDRLDDWLRLTMEDMNLLTQDRDETQWPIYTAFYYLQLLELLFENLAERELLFDFLTTNLLALHDKETTPMDPPILSSDESSLEND